MQVFRFLRLWNLNKSLISFCDVWGTYLQDHVKPQPRKLQRKIVVYKLAILHVKRAPFWPITGLKRDLNQCYVSSIIWRVFYVWSSSMHLGTGFSSWDLSVSSFILYWLQNIMPACSTVYDSVPRRCAPRIFRLVWGGGGGGRHHGVFFFFKFLF